jgi:amino acid adenylation domain-containing protein
LETVLIEPATGRKVTGNELLAEVSRMRLGLNAAGVQRGDFVGLHMGRSIDFVVSLLATWELGAAFVPLNTTLPIDRINLLLADTGAKHVISDYSVGLEVTSSVRVLSPTTIRTQSNSPTALADLPQEEAQPNSCTAYVMYTSGSTGHPKGVRASHENLNAFLSSWDAVVSPAAPGTWLAATAVSFDPSIVELVWTLARGATIVLAPTYGASSSLGALITEYRITHFQCTPSRAKVLLADPLERTAIGQLEHLLIGGEVLSAGLANQLLDTGLKRLTNIYGPTETTVWAFAHEVLPGVTDPIPIGTALPGVAYQVSNRERADHTEQIGELIIGGPSVGSYLHDQSTESPFSHDVASATRWYRTGDLVSVAGVGAAGVGGGKVLTFHGRNDNQIKVNGVRIEPAEIETALESQADVREAVAAIIHAPGGTDHLVAWVVLAGKETKIGGALPADELRERMKHVLPRALLPRVIIELPAFPLTSTGKADRKRLQYSYSVTAKADTDSPLSPVYSITSAIRDFARALNNSKVLEDTNFFEAGGDSLAALELVTAVHDATQITLPLRCLVEAPTPTAFATYVTDHTQFIPPVPERFAADAILVGFSARRTNRPLYIVHGDGGNVIGFRTLAMQLADTFDVVGIEAIGVGPGFEPDETFDAMVDRYAAAIRADRAQGAHLEQLFLGGYSGGGKVAVAVAAVLQGEMAVGPVALFDAAVFETLPSNRTDRLRAIVASARDRGPQSLRRWAKSSFLVWRSRFENDTKTDLPFAHIETVITQATSPRPKHQALANGAFLIRVMQRNPMFEVDFDWSDVVESTVNTYWADGQHLTMFSTPTVGRVADLVRQGFGPHL